MPNYHNPVKLLSMRDLDGNLPEIYIDESNRSAGKTTYYNRWFIREFKEKGDIFMLLYRFDYELDSVSEKFFSEIGRLFYKSDEMTEKHYPKRKYTELFLNGKTCGFAVALNNADFVKKFSHKFALVERMLFDEFQSETNHYAPDEITKFQSIHRSVARGNGKQTRRVPVYMLSNGVSLLNPYYTVFDVSSRLKPDTHYLRGRGWVLSRTVNEDAKKSYQASGFAAAFAKDAYSKFSGENVYLNDNVIFIEKPNGKSRYIATIANAETICGIYEYPESGILFVSNSYDKTFPVKYTTTAAAVNVDFAAPRAGLGILSVYRDYFSSGRVRFADLNCKKCFFDFASY